MALTDDSPMKQEVGVLTHYPVAASTTIYEGGAVGGNGSGYARELNAGDPFLGHAQKQVDNSSGDAGAENVRVYTGCYRRQVEITSIAITDVGKKVYASDDATYTLTGGSNSLVGKVHRYVTTNTCIVEFMANDAGAGWDIALGTITGSAADNAFALTVDDATTFSSGYANMVYLNLTNSGDKTGGAAVSQINGFAADITMAGTGNLNGMYLYIDDSGSPDLSGNCVAAMNLDLQEMGATDYFTTLWLQKTNTTKGTTVDAFILMSLQGAGVAKSGIHFQGIALPDYFITIPGSARDMLTAAAPGAGSTCYLKVDLNGSEYKIKLESEAS